LEILEDLDEFEFLELLRLIEDEKKWTMYISLLPHFENKISFEEFIGKKEKKDITTKDLETIEKENELIIQSMMI
jgi:hypothetical protein